MFFFYTGHAQLDNAIDEALALTNAGREFDACRVLVSALADTPAPAGKEDEKAALIGQIRTHMQILAHSRIAGLS